MKYDIKGETVYTVKLSEAEALLIGMALDSFSNTFEFKSAALDEAFTDFSIDWDDMVSVDDYDHLHKEFIAP